MLEKFPVELHYCFSIIVCDTGVVIPNKPKSSHPKNQMYECRVCAVECNSEVMYQQHVQGAKHKKKVNRTKELVIYNLIPRLSKKRQC